MKTCIRCHQEKLIEAFHKHKMMRDGRLNKCASCVVECVAEWRKKNPQKRNQEYESAVAKGKRTRQRKQSDIVRDRKSVV